MATTVHYHLLHIVGSFLVGCAFRYFRIKWRKKHLLSALGIALIIVCCGLDAFYLAVLVGGGCLIIKTTENPRYVFAFAFAWRLVFCSADRLGLPSNNFALANALMLVATLKVIVVAYEVFDFRKRKISVQAGKANEVTGGRWLGVLALDKEPDTMDIICYMTCLPALFTGPIYKYKTFEDMFKEQCRPVKALLVRKSALVAMFGVIMLSISFLFDTDYFVRESVQSDPVYIRWLYVFPVGLFLQMRLMGVWAIAETTCILFGLGMYRSKSKPKPGQGPTELYKTRSSRTDEQNEREEEEWDFTTVRNTDVEACFPATWSFSGAIPAWNSTVQWWMVHFVYRSALLPRRMRFLRAMSVFFVSALWHGTKLGYFVTFLQIPLVMALERFCLHVEKKCIREEWKKEAYKTFHRVFVKHFGHSYFFVSFTLLDSNFIQLTWFAGLLFPFAMSLMCGIIWLVVGQHEFPAILMRNRLNDFAKRD